MASYTLQITLPDGRDAAAGLIPPSGFFSSDGEWKRSLSVHLDGFSTDGQHIFGVISEGGRNSFVEVFDFKRDGSHSEIVVPQGPARLRAARCGTSFAVAGTTGAGDPVLEPDTSERCRLNHRWVVDKKGTLRSLARGDTLKTLFTPPGQ